MTPAQALALRLANWKAAADLVIANEEEAARPSLPPKHEKKGGA